MHFLGRGTGGRTWKKHILPILSQIEQIYGIAPLVGAPLVLRWQPQGSSLKVRSRPPSEESININPSSSNCLLSSHSACAPPEALDSGEKL